MNKLLLFHIFSPGQQNSPLQLFVKAKAKINTIYAEVGDYVTSTHRFLNTAPGVTSNLTSAASTQNLSLSNLNGLNGSSGPSSGASSNQNSGDYNGGVVSEAARKAVEDYEKKVSFM